MLTCFLSLSFAFISHIIETESYCMVICFAKVFSVDSMFLRFFWYEHINSFWYCWVVVSYWAETKICFFFHKFRDIWIVSRSGLLWISCYEYLHVDTCVNVCFYFFGINIWELNSWILWKVYIEFYKKLLKWLPSDHSIHILTSNAEVSQLLSLYVIIC